MRNECNIIRDILPLYVEAMVSADTADLVEEHLEKCAACRAELEAMKKPGGAEPVMHDVQDNSAMPLRAFKKRWSQRKRIMIGATAFITALVVLLSYLVGSGFSKRTDVMLVDHSVSADGTELTLHTAIASSMGYIRGFTDRGGGAKPHYLIFYNTFGGLNSSFGAKHEFTLKLDEADTEIWFIRADGGYELVLQKDTETGKWVRP